MWYTQDHDFATECYMWCTGSGALPEEIPESNDGLIEELVRTEFTILGMTKNDMFFVHFFPSRPIPIQK